MLDGHKAKIRIALKSGMIEHRERDQGIVFGLHEQSGHADAIQKLIGGLRGVIVVRSAESE